MRERIRSVFFMFGICLVFTAAVSAVNRMNVDRIRQNEQMRIQGLVLNVLQIDSGASLSDREISGLFQKRVRTSTIGNRPLYVGLDPTGQSVVGYAFPISGPGFWGPIEAMIATDQQVSRIIGVAFYRHSETPGLGGRITESWFQKQFQGRTLETPVPGKRYFTFKAQGTAKGNAELDAITGATETTRRLEVFLDEELKKTLAVLAEKTSDPKQIE
uniref:FMN-binding protein n=1 Tax=Desulfatirhabdium butyrativorans TaxID=340467 RepID=A0A7C4RSU2_9BACT